MIREYEDCDYKSIVYLLELCGLPLVEADELKGFGLLWEERGEPVGFVWALTNEGASAYLDHFCIHPDFRRKNEFGRTEIGFWLLMAMMTKLDAMGKTRLIGILQDTPGGKSFSNIYENVGIKFIKPEAYIRGNIQEILKKVKEHNYG